MKDKFIEKKVDYFWEYDYAFGEFFLKELFGDNYKRKYSMDGTGIYNLVYGTDGKVYDLKLTQAKKMVESDELLSRNSYQCMMADLLVENLPNATVSKKKIITFPLGDTIAKIEITKKMKEPV
jgi:hypothetical protein